MSRLRHTIAITYGCHLYVSVIGVLLTPFYLRYLGMEGFGIAGFYVMLSTLFQLLDMGMTPIFSNRVANFRAGEGAVGELRRLAVSLEVFFAILAVATMTAGMYFSNWISDVWLRPETLDRRAVASCISVMAITISSRWLSALYKSGLVGFERQNEVNAITFAVATLRFVFVIPFFEYVSRDITDYFLYQLSVALIELVLLAYVFRCRVFPLSLVEMPSFRAFCRILPFALQVGGASMLSTAIMYLDRFFLSRVLSLSEYGYYSLAVMVSGALFFIVYPIIQIFQPRMTVMAAERRYSDLAGEVQSVTQFVTVLAVSLCGVLAIFGDRIIWIWTGSRELADQVAPLVFWYSLGNLMVILLTLPYLLQMAVGRVRLHFVGVLGMLLAMIPAVFFVAGHYGAIGTGVLWFGCNALYFLLWVPRIFRSLKVIGYFDWIIYSVALPGGITLAPLLLAWFAGIAGGDRLGDLILITGFALVSLVVGLIAGRGCIVWLRRSVISSG